MVDALVSRGHSRESVKSEHLARGQELARRRQPVPPPPEQLIHLLIRRRYPQHSVVSLGGPVELIDHLLDHAPGQRVDVALFDLRLFKSRSAATAAIHDGAALLNGAVVKPSHGVRPGDRITLVGASGRRTVEVVELPRAGLSREAAHALLREAGSEPRGPAR